MKNAFLVMSLIMYVFLTIAYMAASASGINNMIFTSMSCIIFLILNISEKLEKL